MGVNEGFFTEAARYNRERLSIEGRTIEIPDGWSVTAQVSRIVCAGLCTLQSLNDVTTSPEEYFEMHRLLDWQDYVKSESRRVSDGGS